MRLGIISDTHLAPIGSPAAAWHNPLRFDIAEALLGLAVDQLSGQDLDAVAVLGDLVHFGDRPSFEKGLRLLERFEVPVYIVPGNHDRMELEDVWRRAIEEWPSSRVVIPNRERHDALPFQVVGISRLDIDPRREIWCVPEGTIDADGDEPLLALSHFPLLDREAEIVANGLKFASSFSWSGSIESILTRKAPLVFLHGHLHIRDEATEGAVLQLGFASLIEPPHAAAIVEVFAIGDELRVDIRHIDVAEYDVPVSPVLSPPRSSWEFRGGSWQRSDVQSVLTSK